MSTNVRRIVAIAAVALLTGGVVTTAMGGDSAPATESVVERPPTDGKYRLSKARGVDHARAATAVRLEREEVRVAEGNGWRCMLFDDGIDSCQRPALIEAGLSLDVLNDCATEGTRAMRIAGQVPPGVRTVVVEWDGGTDRRAEVARGVFALSGRTPLGDEPVPTTIRWLDGSGALVATHAFPVGRGQFCPS